MQIINKKKKLIKKYGTKGKIRIVGGVISSILTYSVGLILALNTMSYWPIPLAIVVFVGIGIFIATTPEEWVESGGFIYECKLDKNDSILELEEKYDIIEQYDDIFILGDKE